MIYNYIGRRQLGKTTLAYSMTIKCPKRIIFDPRKQIFSSGVRVATVAEFDDAIDRLHAIGSDDVIDEILITPSDDLMPLFARASIAVKDWGAVYELESRDRYRLMYLVDEAALFDLEQSSAFRYILRAVPPDLVNVGLTAHRPQDIPTNVRAISDHWLIFRTTQEHDLDMIERRTSPAVARRVATLNPHEFVHWNDARAEMAVFLNPAAWYVKLDRGRLNAPAEIMPGDGQRLEKEVDLFGSR